MLKQPFSWNEMNRLRRDMDNLFEGVMPTVYRQRARAFPAINMWTNEKEGAIVMAELPGMSTEDISISVTADTLTLSGSREPVAAPQSEKYHRRELSYGSFNRVIQLPYTVNKDKVEASMHKGILQISLPRAEAEKPKQIAVKGSS